MQHPSYSFHSKFDLVIAGLKDSYTKKKYFFSVSNTKTSMSLISFLLKENLISSYFRHNNKLIIFLSYYQGRSPFLFLEKKSSRSHPFPVSVRQLKHFRKYFKMYTYVLSTSMGILTDEQAIYRNVGGILLFYIRW